MGGEFFQEGRIRALEAGELVSLWPGTGFDLGLERPHPEQVFRHALIAFLPLFLVHWEQWW
jgi:hypothetical protein